MNNKGQTLILFLLILPIIISFLSFFIDLSQIKYEKEKINSIILSNLKVIIDKEIKDIDKIKDVYLENDLFVEVLMNENEIIIKCDTKVDSIFGKFLDFDIYKLNVNYKGDYLSKEVWKI